MDCFVARKIALFMPWAGPASTPSRRSTPILPTEKVTVETLAEITHLSPSHFTRVFRKELGRSPIEYVQGIRLERANKLLLAGDTSISDIALECGFGSSSYLSACFQKQYRMTPREYRNGHGE